MPENKDLPLVPFPMKLYWGELSKAQCKTESEAVKVTMIDYPKDDFRKRCAKMILTTWTDSPIKDLTREQVNTAFEEMLTGKTLPNPMEGLIFTFLIEGMSMTDVTHFLRHRTMSSVVAKTSGERDLRHDDYLIPTSINNSEFRHEYLKYIEMGKNLYAKMVDSRKISIMDARHVLPRADLYFYYASMNLKDAIAYINQRKCSAVQTITDNLIAKGIFEEISIIIPEIKNVVSLKCDKRCHFVNSPLDKNTRLYIPDATHAKLMEYNPNNYLYRKRRYEMGSPKTIQDE